MNLKYLGDALDHWKGSIISRLRERNLLHQLKVDQMATDFPQWGEIDHSIYADLLRIDRSMLVRHLQDLGRNRKAYFEEILSHESDLFLDPDTGICTNSRPGVVHLKASELHATLDQTPTRIVMVYQHVRAQKTRDRVLEVMDYLQQKGPGFHAYSYESASVAMLFFSRRPDRLEPIGEFYKHMLDWHASQRIWHWQSPAAELKLMVHR